MMRCTTHLLFLVPLFLSACEGGDLLQPQTRGHAGTAVQNPFTYSSANEEIFSRDSGAIPLLTVDLPNNRAQQPVVHTIVEDLGNVIRPTTRPTAASQPASQPTVEPIPDSGNGARAPGGPLKLVSQSKPADHIDLIPDNEGNILIRITSPSGIGNIELERTGEIWPAIIHVELRYAADKPFTNLEAFIAAEIVGENRRLDFKSTVDKSNGRADITIPGFTRSPRLAIRWIDAYR